MTAPTLSMLMAARKRLTTAKRNKTRADHYEASTSGLGASYASISARKMTAAEAELAAAQKHHDEIANHFRLAKLPVEARATAIALHEEMKSAAE